MSGTLSEARRIAITLATVVVLALLGYLAVAKPFAAKGRLITADFGAAGQGLTKSSPVKMRGVTVGRVSEIELAPGGGARLTLRIDEHVPVPDSAVASLEPESMFGPKFVNLIPGPHEEVGPFLADGATIERTSDSLDLTGLLGEADAAVGAMDPAQVAVVVDALAQGLGGAGPNLAGLLDSTETLLGVAYDQRGRAESFLADLARLARLRGIGADTATVVTNSTALMETLTSGKDRGLKTAAGVSQLSALLGPGLSRHEGDLRAAFRSGENATAFLDHVLPIAGDGVRTVIDLLWVFKAISWAPGPQGKHLLSAEILLPTDPCELIIGICPGSTGGN
ncbi:phospholipid/cholesterol/gamma-HCH transport system substrate-binding protein [Actinocorallia herbida]|uniref:Phospholipid/cholesterol/gamma-HCH transport system substrate-binding protein n=1 Tax=Actinocorallia herbida TaxID=58109 RepID=A0A3N1CXF9_9ACTN|nr:MlaD family protein [Actinocorallia herbida]ROO85954.1 phospholipid/cholesterol/gamma-HCH transport system substrate-binding protein [Actinocorallia herbida]